MNSDFLDVIDMRELGKELQQARSRRGLTQEEAAKIIDVARTTITAIEKGERRIKAEELIKLAYAYGREVTDFIRPRPQFEPFQAQFRNLPLFSSQENTQIALYIDTLEELSRNYLELEQITGTPLVRKYPPEYQISGLRIEQAAMGVAIEERNRLGLGDGPIRTLRDILEQDVGLRIFYLPFYPSKLSYIYVYDHRAGACIAVNSSLSEEHRRWSLAHAYGHFLVYRHKPGIFIDGNHQRLSESERFAGEFARYFLMPTSGLTRRFNDIRRTKQHLTPADLCTLALYYGVSVAAITLCLEDMRLLPASTWNKLRAGGFKTQAGKQQHGLSATQVRDEKLPVRYQYLALDAFDRALISEGQFARFLGVDRIEARHIGEILRQHTSGVMDDTPIDLDMTQSLGA
ncbi:MAG TPA: XRE family transcriptional regulator [Ktedonobacteraceae bacterium]|jgi:Zn-dependent peptidase ImmA (M78 family)/DNA-binding XRE family transcriptional regulator|nr:XRE family transcriptional regulator [Ktedonobacteraceae bacterium]